MQRVMKINASTKSLVERLCDFKIHAISVLGFIGSVCAPDRATLTAKNHGLQCTTAGPYNAPLSNLLGVGSICGLCPNMCVLTLSALRRAIESQHDRPRLLKVLRKSIRLVDTIALIFAFSHHFGEKISRSLHGHWHRGRFYIVCCLDRNDTLDEVPQRKEGCYWASP